MDWKLGILEIIGSYYPQRGEMNQGKAISKSGKRPPSGAIVEASFTDFDSFAHALTAWDLDFLQLDNGPLLANLTQITLARSNLLRCFFGRDFQQTGGIPEGLRTIGIPLPGCPPFLWYDREVDDGTIMIFPRGGQLDTRSYAGFKVITLSVEESKLQSMAEREKMPLPLDQGAIATRPPADQLARIHLLANQLVEQGRASEEIAGSSGFKDAVENDLAFLAIEALRGDGIRPERPMARERSRVLKSALAIIDVHVEGPLQISRICDLTGASSRTLRYAFEEKLNTSPKLYLKARRLNELRRRLRNSSPDSSVKETAIELGFWHMGQLAADYRLMFGELPSVTLGIRSHRPT